MINTERLFSEIKVISLSILLIVSMTFIMILFGKN